MKILVLTRSVLDSSAPIYPDTKTGQLHSRWVMNPFDVAALESSVLLKKQCDNHIELVAVGFGDNAGLTALERALAIGADRAIAIQDVTLESRPNPQINPQRLIMYLTEIIGKEQPELIFIGRMAYGQDQGEVAALLAGTLRWTFAMSVNEIESLDTASLSLNIIQRRSSLNHYAKVELPAVISCDLDLAIPKYITLPALAKARHKPKMLWTKQVIFNEDDVVWQPSQKVIDSCKELKNVDELVDVIRSGGCR